MFWKYTADLQENTHAEVPFQFYFIEIAFQHRWSPVNLLYIFRKSFLRNASGWMLLETLSKSSVSLRNSLLNQGQEMTKSCCTHSKVTVIIFSVIFSSWYKDQKCQNFFSVRKYPKPKIVFSFYVVYFHVLYCCLLLRK